MNHSGYVVWLDNARITASFFIVMLHVTALLVSSGIENITYWSMAGIIYGTGRSAIPIFVMISGAILLTNGQGESSSRFYVKRAKRILPVLIFWSVFYYVLQLFYNSRIGIDSGYLIKDWILYGKPHYHLWFIYMICGLYLFTPYFRKVCDRINQREELFLIIVMFLIAGIDYLYKVINPGSERLILFSFIQYIPYYFLGHYINNYDTTPKSKVTLTIVLILAILSGNYFEKYKFGHEIGVYVNGYLSVFMVLYSVSIFRILKNWRKPFISEVFGKKLAEMSLGVYLIHPIFLKLIWILYPGITNNNPLVIIPLVSVAVYSFALITSFILREMRLTRIIITGLRD